MQKGNLSAHKRDHGSVEPLESRIAPSVFIVTSLADSGTGTLRDALQKADSHPGVDTIKFHLTPAVAPAENTIQLVTPLHSNGDVIIDGPGAGKLIISGAVNVRVLSIYDGSATTDSPATISGLSIVNGHSIGEGAGIFSNESLTLKNVVVTGCGAESGGGVAVDSDGGVFLKASISGCTITGNSAGAEGGLALYGVKSASVTNTTIAGNNDDNQGGCGGVLVGTSATAAIKFSGDTISGNSGVYAGGFLLDCANGKVTISNSVISGNMATKTSGSAGGGGIYIKQGSVAISNCKITGNTSATNGGGIQAMKASLQIAKTAISGNTTANTGAGFDLYHMSAVTMTGVTIGDNADYSTVHGGGGGYVELATTGTAITITGSTISGNSADHGGGLLLSGYAQNSTQKITITNSRITGNSSTNTGKSGGAGLATGYGLFTLTGCQVSGNISGGINGGGIEANNFTSFAIAKSSITGNQTLKNSNSAKYGGGGIYATASGNYVPLTIVGSVISGNQSASGGGGLFAFYDMAVTLTRTTVTGNVAASGGGGINAYGAGMKLVSLTINGGTISNNSLGPSGGAGGGILMSGADKFDMTGVKVTGNSSSSVGGGISTGQEVLTMTNCDFSDNTSFSRGGGMAMFTTTFTIKNGHATGSFAQLGGFAYIFNSTGTIEGMTITGNSANNGGGILEANSTVTVQAAKVFANSAPTGPDFSGSFTFV